MYDLIIVGSGLYGAVFARQASQQGYRCLVLEKRAHMAGNCHTPLMDGILVHQYGAHIFHTKHQQVWDYVNKFSQFNHYRNAPIANYKGEIYNLPFNMNTFNRLWGVKTPREAEEKLAQQRRAVYTENPQNLEEQALNLVGPEIYEKLIKHYTQKQWGRPCDQLPAFIIRRLPLRLTYDNNYFDDPWQGIPTQGYTAMVETMLQGIEVKLETDYLKDRAHWDRQTSLVVFTGAIDAFFNYSLSALQYRSLSFDTQTLSQSNYQGNAVVNYTDPQTPYTRVIEHKHFTFGAQPHTIISREYSVAWSPGQEAYYPINDQTNNALYQRYKRLAADLPHVHFGGRLGTYSYLNMDQVIAAALEDSTPEVLRRWLKNVESLRS